MEASERSRHIVVVGASLAGVNTVEQLRSAGYDGRITLVGKEHHLPYDRPPLSKQLLSGARGPDDVLLRPETKLDDLDVDLRLGRTATAVSGDVLLLDGGERLRYSDLVIATGVSARRLTGQPDQASVSVLRTLDDALHLREQLETSGSLVVVGAGFIGAEAAAAARSAGLDVTMVEARPTPFEHTLGPQAGAHCASLHTDRGVRLLANAAIERFDATATRASISLSDGRTVEADHVLVGVGTRPNADWLAGLGVDARMGVACDEDGRVEGLESVYAVGDIASWYNPLYGERHRVEHWTNAVEQARIVAHSILGVARGRAAPRVPYFWSDQYGVKVQLVGRPELADHTSLGPVPGKPGALAGTYSRSGRLVAAVSFDAPAVLARYRPLVARMASEEEAEAYKRGPADSRV